MNDEDPEERITIPWAIVGQQSDASQSFGSALTYARRYFLLQYFASSTQEDDPDTFRSRQREAEHEEDRLIARRIVDQVHALVTEHLAKVPDDRQKILDLTKKHTKEATIESGTGFVFQPESLVLLNSFWDCLIWNWLQLIGTQRIGDTLRWTEYAP